MIYMLSGIILGVILGVLVARFAPRKILGWFVAGLGLLAFVFILPVGYAILAQTDTGFLPVVSIPLAIGCVIPAVGAIRNNLRTWPVWTGLGLATVPLLFWIVFGIGEILFPH